jgi:hypothetical protein
MKILNGIASCASLAFLLVAFFGCEQEESPPPPGYEPRTVSVYVYDDTLREFPCTPHAETPGFAMVEDRAGRVVKGEFVDFDVMPPELGWIEFADSVLRDTTNDWGRVEFFFHSYGYDGDVRITASVGAYIGSCMLAIVGSHKVVASIAITLSRDTLWVGPGQPDSVLISVCYKDSSGAGVYCEPFPVLPRISGGRIRPFSSATDSTGCTHLWWWWAECCGTYCASTCYGTFCDTACVFVDSL